MDQRLGWKVDTLRARFFFGLMVPINDLAFSQMTDMGLCFAIRYVGGKALLLTY
jgi:hypothetical protein